jgi:type I restriction enzyme S subunit
MNEWKEIFLRDVCTEISYGYTASATHENTGVKFLRITDIVNTPFNWDTVPYCEINKKDTEKYKLYPGDIVIARTGATTGTTFTITDETKAVFASYLIRYKIDITKASPYFIGHNLKSENWKGYVENIIGGSAQPGANAQQFAGYEFLLPPLPEQERIAEVLSSLDDKIDLLHRNNKTLEQLAETLFRQWFVEEAEDSWELFTLSLFTDFYNGKSRPVEIGNIPIYGGNGVLGYTNKFNFKDESIIIGRVGAYCGSLYYENRPIWVSDNALLIKPKENDCIHYLFHLLKTLDLNSMAEGSSHPLLTQGLLKSIEFQKPPLSKIIKFNTLVKEWAEKIYTNRSQIQQLETLRDTLLPKLMSGVVRVN